MTAGGAEPVLRTRGLTREYATGCGIFGVDLAVPATGVYGLVGPNGAGKTTLLSIVSGLRRSTSGRVELTVPVSRVALCPDVPEFEPWLTAREVVDLSRALAAPHRGRDEVDRALAEAGLAEAADRRVGGFSRGMAQRLGIAAALVTDPALIILDEPTSALDPVGRAELLGLVADLGRRAAVILSSHNLAEVQRIATTIGVMRAGRLLYQGTVRDLVDRHLRPRWRIRLRGGAPALAEALHTEPWVVTAEPDGPDTLTVETRTTEDGERHLAAAIARPGLALIALQPLDDDLESAFLALTAAHPDAADTTDTADPAEELIA